MSFPPATEMFQFAGFASPTYEFSRRSPLRDGVAPFGDPGINDCSHLPPAYRSVPRPSSPLSAKASTKCPYLTLDRKTHRSQGQAPQRRQVSHEDTLRGPSADSVAVKDSRHDTESRQQISQQLQLLGYSTLHHVKDHTRPTFIASPDQDDAATRHCFSRSEQRPSFRADGGSCAAAGWWR